LQHLPYKTMMTIKELSDFDGKTAKRPEDKWEKEVAEIWGTRGEDGMVASALADDPIED